MGRLPVLTALLFTLLGQTAHALDFDKEIAKNEKVTVSLSDSLDKQQPPAQDKKSNCECTVRLIKVRKIASR